MKFDKEYISFTQQKYLFYQVEPQYKRLGFTDRGSHLET